MVLYALEIISSDQCKLNIDQNDELCLKDIDSNCDNHFYFSDIEKVKEFYKKYRNSKLIFYLMIRLPELEIKNPIFNPEDEKKIKWVDFLEEKFGYTGYQLYEHHGNLNGVIDVLVESETEIDDIYKKYLECCEKIKNEFK